MVELESTIGPGDDADAWLTVAVPQYWDGLVEVGDSLEGGEGSRIVATATVLAVVAVS